MNVNNVFIERRTQQRRRLCEKSNCDQAKIFFSVSSDPMRKSAIHKHCTSKLTEF